MVTISLDNSEIEILKQVLMNATLSGNIKTLTQAMQLIANIMTKLEDATRTQHDEQV